MLAEAKELSLKINPQLQPSPVDGLPGKVRVEFHDAGHYWVMSRPATIEAGSEEPENISS